MRVTSKEKPLVAPPKHRHIEEVLKEKTEPLPDINLDDIARHIHDLTDHKKQIIEIALTREAPEAASILGLHEASVHSSISLICTDVRIDYRHGKRKLILAQAWARYQERLQKGELVFVKEAPTPQEERELLRLFRSLEPDSRQRLLATARMLK